MKHARLALPVALALAAVASAQRATRSIDDFESPELFERWRFNGSGRIILQSERVKQGRSAMRFDCPLALHNGQRRYQIANLYLGKEDWSEFNRVSFWVYFDAPGKKHVSLGAVVHNANDPPEGTDDKERGQTRIATARHSMVVPPGTWVKIDWDIPEWRRDKVVLLQIAKTSSGYLPGEIDHVTGYFDDLRLEKVDPPKYVGWDTPPGLVSFVHTGYLPFARKIAAMPDGTASRSFRIVNERTGSVAFSGDLRTVPICASKPRAADFSKLTAPGVYRIVAGGSRSEPFRIGDDVLASPTQKVLNFIWCQRCGIDVPGVHGACHLDNCRPVLRRARSWRREEKEALLKQMGGHFDLAGGWHDAGIVDQYTPNTAWITYGLCRLAEVDTIRWDRDGDGADDVLEEAEWGARWLLKLLMPDGDLINSTGGDAWWTDNKVGTADDRRCDACGTYPQFHFATIAAQARVARALKDRRPDLARQSLQNARTTWTFVTTRRWPDREKAALDIAARCAIAGIELWLTTGDDEFRDVALEMLNLMAACQERGGAVPGFFYRSPKHERIFRDRNGLGHLIYAFALACEQLPAHPGRGKWLDALRQYVDGYVSRVVEHNAPYRTMPFGLYDANESHLLRGKESWWVRPWDPRAFVEFPSTDEYMAKVGDRSLSRIRRAVGGQHRLYLAESIGLAAAARVLGHAAALDHALDQVNWLLGLNPFSMTMLWGEGHRSPVPYCPMPGLMVGAIGLGVGSLDNSRPYFSPQIAWNQREVWTIAGGMFVWAVAEIEQTRSAAAVGR